MKTETETLIIAMRNLAEDIESQDGVANAAIAEAADRLADLQDEVERLRAAAENTLDAIQDALQDAYYNAGLVCCGRGGEECCGCPETEWSEADQAIMNVLGPIEKQLREAIIPQPEIGEASDG